MIAGRVAWRLLAPAADELVVLDAGRRTYAALSRKGDRYHLIQPAQADDPRVGDGLRLAGQLVCTCSGGTFRGTCYQVERAEAFEAGRAADPAWLDVPAGAAS